MSVTNIRPARHPWAVERGTKWLREWFLPHDDSPVMMVELTAAEIERLAKDHVGLSQHTTSPAEREYHVARYNQLCELIAQASGEQSTMNGAPA